MANKTVKAKAKKKVAKKKTAKKKPPANSKKHPVKQGDYEVGNKKPPKEQQFKPGQSGNPKGPPVRRTQLWVWFCKYMNMTDAQLAKLAKTKLTQAQQAALAIVENMKNGKYSGSQRLAKDIFDREEGRAVEHIIIGDETALSDDECEEIRKLILENHANN